jgi:DNA-binding transcriptional ArsR family regulator
MTMAKIGKHLIRSEEQLAALVAPARQEIVDVLAELGAVSVAELATALGRPADALYFHLRALTRAGLVRKAGYRSRPRGKEALYRAAAPDLQLHYEPRKAPNRKAVSAIVASMLRLTTRDFRGAFERSTVAVSGPYRELWGLRKAGRLSRSRLGEVNRDINRLVSTVSGSGRRGRLYAVTVVLTPLDQRNVIDGTMKLQPRKREAKR